MHDIHKPELKTPYILLQHSTYTGCVHIACVLMVQIWEATDTANHALIASLADVGCIDKLEGVCCCL